MCAKALSGSHLVPPKNETESEEMRTLPPKRPAASSGTVRTNVVTDKGWAKQTDAAVARRRTVMMEADI